MIDRRKGNHPKGPGLAEKVGPPELHEVQEGQMQGAVPGSGQSQICVLTEQNSLRSSLWRKTWEFQWTKRGT